MTCMIASDPEAGRWACFKVSGHKQPVRHDVCRPLFEWHTILNPWGLLAMGLCANRGVAAKRLTAIFNRPPTSRRLSPMAMASKLTASGAPSPMAP